MEPMSSYAHDFVLFSCGYIIIQCQWSNPNVLNRPGAPYINMD